ncbi:cobyric acid synthase [Cognatishimia maritima]|uniref:Cobyric acid synthase n=1 Tax=Cognatishimia maritima TaxID=870908 RepID=A0A1M5UDN0_9RHOB|nr:cobyric acid synthase [Cognatishimia maritima]SHH61050.1 adenosylcobyric acid synthase (glutamine-hydrolysing) [Cognatishimia maritima]
MTKAIMIQGTGSNVGKSMLVAGLCRAAARRGLSVAPFKPQNMSNNAAVTSDGGEIGRAQALQALACNVPLTVHMNPVLLKPETDVGSQVVVQGKRLTTVKARDYAKLKPQLMERVMESFNLLKSQHDLVIVEGAGSPAEVNLRAGDIANMGFAQASGTPVILAGDIDRGGVIAQIVGTQAVIDAKDAALIKGFLVNKFRGDPSLFDDGYALIEQKTGWRGFGVLPYFQDAWKLPAEDALDIRSNASHGQFHIVCLGLSRIANFDDLDPLAQETNVRLTMLRAGQAIPGDADLVIIPGSKSTRGDLAFLRDQGWHIDLQAHLRRGGKVLGICGGYQMLGQMIADPDGIEGAAGETAGLGLLDVATVMTPDKRLTETKAVHAASGQVFSGYEIHIGRTQGTDCARPFATVAGRDEGAVSADGAVMGSYLHGMFADDGFRRAFLTSLGAEAGHTNYAQSVEATLDALADHIEAHLDVNGVLSCAR